jgi:hypothetical protein
MPGQRAPGQRHLQNFGHLEGEHIQSDLPPILFSFSYVCIAGLTTAVTFPVHVIDR